MEATETVQRVTTENYRHFCTFWISGQLFGVDILNVKEINSEFTCTPIFHATREIKGYVNIRGQIHLVLDLRMLLGFESDDDIRGKRLVIFKQSLGEPFGVLVDKIGDVLQVNVDQIEDRKTVEEGAGADDQRNQAPDLIQGVCKLKEELLVVMKAENFLESIEKQDV